MDGQSEEEPALTVSLLLYTCMRLDASAGRGAPQHDKLFYFFFSFILLPLFVCALVCVCVFARRPAVLLRPQSEAAVSC